MSFHEHKSLIMCCVYIYLVHRNEAGCAAALFSSGSSYVINAIDLMDKCRL